jgi:putative membrane protein
MEIIISWLVYSLAIVVTAYILPGVHVDSFGTALITALVLGIINALLKPILLLLTLPINILTLGLFTLVINALLILLVASIVTGFKVDGFWWALLFSIILSFVSAFFSSAASTAAAA